MIHIKYAFVLAHYGVIKTIKPTKLHEYVRNNNMRAQNTFNKPDDTKMSPERSERSEMQMTVNNHPDGDMPPMHRAMSNSDSNGAPLPIDVEAALPSLQPTITPCSSAENMGVANLQSQSHSNSTESEKNRQRHLETMYESELEQNIDEDYQVIDFNDTGAQSDSDSNSIAQNYLTVHSYIFAENGQIVARIELPSGTN